MGERAQVVVIGAGSAGAVIARRLVDAGATVILVEAGGLGGSSAINGMIYIRGHRLDDDHWAYLGNHGWGWDDVLPLFRRSEDFAGGPWHVLSRYEPDPLHASIIEAAVAAGIPRTDDHNGERIDGVCQTHFSIRDGRRDSTASALSYAHPVGTCRMGTELVAASLGLAA